MQESIKSSVKLPHNSFSPRSLTFGGSGGIIVDSRTANPLELYMTTTSGRSYKAMDNDTYPAEEVLAEPRSPSGNTEEAIRQAHAPSEVSGIADVLRMMIEDRERREQEIA